MSEIYERLISVVSTVQGYLKAQRSNSSPCTVLLPAGRLRALMVCKVYLLRQPSALVSTPGQGHGY